MPLSLPDAKYDIVLADPPWEYYGQQDKWAAAAKFYHLLKDEALGALDVPGILNEPGILFLWTTSSKLDKAVWLIEEWSLYYRGVAFVWIKTKQDSITPIGAQGVRPSITKPLTEFVLAASNVWGRPLKLSDESICQTIFAPKQEHSKKPDEVQERIERMYPDYSKIELFARRQREGWVTWGDEV